MDTLNSGCCCNGVPKPRKELRCLFGGTKRTERATAFDWTVSPPTHRGNPMTSDVIAPSQWTIFGCQNGLRLFKEARDSQSSSWWDDHPAIMVVGVVDGTSEAVFQTIMSLGPSRSEWDFCFYRGSVVEHLDGHTDIIHEQLSNDWMPWGMGRRDLLLQRYWRRDDDGRYVILYHSVIHKKCPPKNGYVRACVKGGGYVISPVNQGKQSIVKHMLAIDWRLWRSYLLASSAKSVTTHMLQRVAALREFFKAKAGNYTNDLSSRETTKDIGLPQSEKEEIKVEVQPVDEEVKENEEISEQKEEAILSSGLVGLNDVSDEFFDVPEPADDEHLESEWSLESSHELINEVLHPNLFFGFSFYHEIVMKGMRIYLLRFS
ncbi:START domain [Dillenia turbinata]|uniref:START domain n=1 Tax=Dillenia turbinata TaxID=194707 RepID=A0AAN8VE44_9MAGN